MFPDVKTSSEIELKIIEAANKVFLQHGVDSTTMGQIADEAGISRTSLNYYFRSKSNLLQTFLANAETMIVPTISRYIDAEDLPLETKIDLFIEDYMGLVIKYPMVPPFILSELNREPNWIIEVIKKSKLNFDKLSAQIDTEAARGRIRPFKLEDLFVNILGLCIIPVISKPLLMEFFFEQDQDKLNQYMADRKNEIKRIIHNWLQPE